MNRTLAQIISFVFHPLLASTYVFVLLIFIFPSSFSLFEFQVKSSFVFAIFLMTFVVPTTSTFFLLRAKAISNISLSERKERNFPLFFTFVIYVVTAIFCFRNLGQDLTFTYIMAFNSLVILGVFLINLFWKISAHTAGAGGLVAYFITFLTFDNSAQYLPYFMVLIVVSGLVISARLALEEHNELQTYSGFVLGFSITYLINIFI